MAQPKSPKKAPAKGQKSKKGSPGQRSFFFKPASIALAFLVALLLILALVYLARVQHWFAAPAGKGAPQERRAKTAPRASGKTSPLPTPGEREEYQEIARSRAFPRPAAPAAGPKVAIIVDDLGADLPFIRELLALDLNLTAAVLPNVAHARETAQLAHASGREVIVHIPMEPKGYPAADPGSDPLFVGLPAGEVRRRLVDYFAAVPHAVGGNNHMGSRFTGDREGMAIVLEFLRDGGMFFVDSRTTADSVAFTQAGEMRVASAERDVFLDNELDEGAIRGQIRKLASIAEKQGSAIGIGHPHAETLAALRKEAPELRRLGISVVAVSELVR